VSFKPVLIFLKEWFKIMEKDAVKYGMLRMTWAVNPIYIESFLNSVSVKEWDFSFLIILPLDLMNAYVYYMFYSYR